MLCLAFRIGSWCGLRGRRPSVEGDGWPCAASPFELGRALAGAVEELLLKGTGGPALARLSVWVALWLGR